MSAPAGHEQSLSGQVRRLIGGLVGREQRCLMRAPKIDRAQVLAGPPIARTPVRLDRGDGEQRGEARGPR
jgi:hypothetical protein